MALLCMGKHACAAPEADIEAQTPDALWHQVESRLQAWNTEQQRPASISLMGNWPDQRAFVPGRFALSWQIVNVDERTRQVKVNLTPVGAGQAAQGGASRQLRVLLRDLEWVWVARAALQERQRVSCQQNLVRQWRTAVAHAPSRWQGECTDLPALELRRPLGTDDVLLVTDLRAPVAVYRMAVVAATARVGVIDIETKARALADADIGQKVKVLPSGAKQAVVATVVAPNAVRIN